jgi:hypothetical protein
MSHLRLNDIKSNLAGNTFYDSGVVFVGHALSRLSLSGQQAYQASGAVSVQQRRGEVNRWRTRPIDKQ